MYEVNGVIKSIGNTQQISEKFIKREVVITTDETYPQDLVFELVQANCELLDGFVPQQKVTASFNLRGREYQKKDGSGLGYFNSMQIWKIFAADSEEVKKVSSFAEKLKNKSLNNLPEQLREEIIDDMAKDQEDDIWDKIENK